MKKVTLLMAVVLSVPGLAMAESVIDDLTEISDRTTQAVSVPQAVAVADFNPPQPAAAQADISKKLHAEIADGNVSPRVTTVAKFKTLFGPPENEATFPDGDATVTMLEYPGYIKAVFVRYKANSTANLFAITEKGVRLDLGVPNLCSVSDLLTIEPFTGLAGMSLVKLDLCDQEEILAKLPFDSLTKWPPMEKLPPGFDPAERLAKGKNPGLGVKKLHALGIDGRGVGIAIIDQPLLETHQEYAAATRLYKTLGVDGVPPQMHGPAVASLAVGRQIGTAPGAGLYFFATPTWKKDNSYYAQALNAVVELNRQSAPNEKIRVVSVSFGGFRESMNYELWQKALAVAQAENILVITCAADWINFGNLSRNPSGNPDSPDVYIPESWDIPMHELWVPGANRTRASNTGESVYAYDVVGGRSWTTPYLAGVAALGYQLNPALTPSEIKEMLLKSATPSKTGPIINPPDFIEMVKKTLGTPALSVAGK